MKKLFEFKCSSCESIFEELTEYKLISTCPSCNFTANKIISSPRIVLEGHSGSFPGAASAWEKKHKQQLAKEIKQQNA